MSLLQSRINLIDSDEVHDLLAELQILTGQSVDQYLSSSLFSYLSSCLYHNPRQKRFKINKDELDSVDPTDSFLLRRKLKTFLGTPIYELCDELVKSHNNVHLNESADRYEGSTLYVFLNQKLPDYGKPKKKSPFRF